MSDYMDARNIGYWLQRIYHDLAGSVMVYVDARKDEYWLQQIYKELTGIDLVGDQRSFDWWSEAIYRHIIGDTSGVKGTVPANTSWQLIYASRASAAYPDGSSALSVEFWIQRAQRVGLETPIPPYVPTDNPNLALWWEAYDAGVADGAPIVTIPVRSAGGGNMVVGLGAPAYGATGLNGYPGIQFDGTAKSLVSPVFLDNTFDTAFTLHIVASRSGAAGLRLMASHNDIEFYMGSDNDSGGGYGSANGYADNLTTQAVNSVAYPRLTAAMNAATIYTYVYNGATLDFYINGNKLGSVASTGNLGLSGTLSFGNLSSGGFPWIGFIGGALVRKEASSTTVLRQDWDYLASRWGLNRIPQIIAIGTSITQGQGIAVGFTYPEQLQGLLGGSSAYDLINIGQGGYTVQQMIDNIASAPLNFYSKLDGLRTQLFIVEGLTNDLFAGESVATCQTRLTNLLNLLNIWRGTLYATTILPRTEAGTPGTFEADRQTLRTWLLTNAAGLGVEAVADVASDATIGCALCSDNLTYYQDGTHPTAAGATVYAGIVHDAL